LRALAEGTTTIKGAEELRLKESDRIKTIATELRKMRLRLKNIGWPEYKRDR